MDNPRVLLAIALSFLVLLIWQAWMQDYGPQPQTVEQTVAGTDPEAAGAAEDLPDAPQDQPPASDPDQVAVQLPEGQRVEIVTDVFRAVIDTRGGGLREVDLLQYPQTTEPDSPPFRLLEESPGQLFIAQSGLRAGEGPEPTHHATFRADQSHFEMAADADTLEVPLHWSDGQGVEVTKLYRFRRGSYLVEVEFQVRNGSASDWSARPYFQLQRTPKQQESRLLYTYTGGVLSSPEEKYQKISFDDMQDDDLSRDVKDGWAAMIEHYFVAAWIPPAERIERYYTRALRGERYVIGSIGPSLSVPAGGTKSTQARLFVGPKLQHAMEEVAPGLELTVD